MPATRRFHGRTVQPDRQHGRRGLKSAPTGPACAFHSAASAQLCRVGHEVDVSPRSKPSRLREPAGAGSLPLAAHAFVAAGRLA